MGTPISGPAPFSPGCSASVFGWLPPADGILTGEVGGSLIPFHWTLRLHHWPWPWPTEGSLCMRMPVERHECRRYFEDRDSPRIRWKWRRCCRQGFEPPVAAREGRRGQCVTGGGPGGQPFDTGRGVNVSGASAPWGGEWAGKRGRVRRRPRQRWCWEGQTEIKCSPEV